MAAANNMLTWEGAVTRLKTHPGNRALVEACFYDDPLAESAKRYHRSTEWKAVRRLLPPIAGKALDIGSGRGISAYALAKDGWATTALEPDPSDIVGAGAIRLLAKETLTAINVVETWGETLPFDNNYFDIVHVRQALHHARDLRQLCCEIARVLKPSGTMLATREHVLSRKEDLPQFLENHPLHRFYGGENAFVLEEYLDAIRTAGIKVTRVLNPLDSDINTYPETRKSIKAAYARKLRLPSLFIPDFLLSWKGDRDRVPGRLYSFVGYKA